MARRTFFSFHYEQDAWRAGQVRNSGLFNNADSVGFIDKAEWENIERQGDENIKRWIDGQLSGTTVTVVLIGAETSNRKWVKYELSKSCERGNAIFGIYIHNVKDSNGQISPKGDTMFGQIFKDKKGNLKYFFELYKVYDWGNDNGRLNISAWIEEAYLNR